MTESDVPPGINHPNVSRFFAEHVPGGDCDLHFSVISGGRSNLTYLVEGGGRQWVMRRPPLGHVLPTAHDMAREFKVLSGVAARDYPAPRPIALCEDTSVNEYPFYIMDYRQGVILDTTLPPGFADTPELRRRIGTGLIENLARLHAIDYNAVGLGDFGYPDGYLERQVRRWSEQWERSKTREFPAIDEVIRRLRNSIPPSPPPTIVHGDYRLGNMMLDPKDPGRVIAVLDWEMATLGDPLSDLGYTLLYWGNADDAPERLSARAQAQLTTLPGFHRREELVADYARLTGVDVSHIAFYEVLAMYKLAVIVEGIWARYLKGQTVGAGFEGLGESSVNLINMALYVADGSPDPRLRGVA